MNKNQNPNLEEFFRRKLAEYEKVRAEDNAAFLADLARLRGDDDHGRAEPEPEPALAELVEPVEPAPAEHIGRDIVESLNLIDEQLKDEIPEIPVEFPSIESPSVAVDLIDSGLGFDIDSDPFESRIQCRFETGVAGSGKTYDTKRRLESEPPGSIVLAASTGIAAVNLGEGITTIHSLLRFFDHNSLQENYLSGRLTRRFVDLSKEGVREIALDEVSMFSGPSLDLLYNAASEAPEYSGRAINLTLIGDFCQLPPVKAPYAFEANCWPEFAKNTNKRTKIWRQSDTRFLEALNHLRRGEGGPAAEILRSMGIPFHSALDDNFEGTTLRAKNDEVDRYNQLRLAQLPSQAFALKSSRWGTPEIYQPAVAGAGAGLDKGKQPGDWKEIPDKLAVKIGARIMILANDTLEWTYVNGSTGILTGLSKLPTGDTALQIKLDNGRQIELTKRIRRVESRKLPDEWEGRAKELRGNTREDAMRKRQPYYYVPEGRRPSCWVRGECEYFPVRLAWASTIHKSQGLTLDRVQIDMRAQFFGAPAMAYVSLSRCKAPEGLRLVGKPEDLARKANVDPRVKEWL